MKKIKEVLDKILNSKIFILLLGIMIFAKTIYFYKNTIMIVNSIEYQTILGTIAFISIIVCILMMFPNKLRIILSLLIDLIISILLLIDNIYYTYSSNFFSVNQIMNIKYREQILDTIPSLIKFSEIIYIIDFILIGMLFLTKVIKIRKENERKRKQKIISIIILVPIIIASYNIFNNCIEKGKDKIYNKDLQVTESTIYGYHILDTLSSLNYSRDTAYKNYEEMIIDYNILKKEYDDKYSKIQYDLKNILENKNILIVQLESVQEFVINKKINGKEITPNLNKFINENIEFTNMHMQSYSSTADSEYSLITSTYPLENGMSFSKYFLNTYDNIFEMYNNKNYYTSYMHGNVGSFWNRGNVYSRMNVDDIVFIDKFNDKSEMIAGFLSDELFYKQAVQKISQQNKPFMTFLVSSSSHTAFDLPGIINKYDKVSIDVGKYKDTFFGNYLEAMNYADYAFGILIDELKQAEIYDDLGILVFGDHNGLGMYDEQLQEFLKESNPDLKDIDLKLNYTRVLCGMKIPGINEHIVINKVINKLDLKPTFAYLCNLEDTFSLGTNIFASKDFICLNNEKIISEKYYYDLDWFNIQSGEKIDIDMISQEEKEQLETYYNYMKKELDISFSVNINNLLK